MRITPSRFFVIGVSLVLITIFSTTRGYTFRHLHQGVTAPDFKLERTDGGFGTLYEALGKDPLIVVFWASWSKRSLEELRDIERLRQSEDELEFNVLAVNVDAQALSAERKDSLRVLIQQLGVSYPFYWDDGLNVFNDYGVIAVPSSLVLDSLGTVRVIINGYSSRGKTLLADSIRQFNGKLPPEIAAVDTSVHRPPKKALLHFRLGNRLFRKKKFRQAVVQYEMANAIDSTFSKALLSLGEALEKQGESTKAEEAYQKALTLDQGDAHALWRLGRIERKRGNTDLALEYLERALKADENLYPARLELAEIRIGQGDIKAAELDVELAEEANPNDPRVKSVRATIAEENGDLQTAVLILRTTVEEQIQMNR